MNLNNVETQLRYFSYTQTMKERFLKKLEHIDPTDVDAFFEFAFSSDAIECHLIFS